MTAISDRGHGVHGDGEVFVALLRGINVGGKNLLPMKELQQIFASAGCMDVRTYIQSGNVVFRASSAGWVEKVSEAIRVPVVLRSKKELEACVAGNPYATEKELHVMFLKDVPSEEALSGLDPRRSDPDTFEVRGRDVYMRLLTGGAKTKLTNQYFDSRLRTTSTVRNWNTVRKLLEMCSL